MFVCTYNVHRAVRSILTSMNQNRTDRLNRQCVPRQLLRPGHLKGLWGNLLIPHIKHVS